MVGPGLVLSPLTKGGYMGVVPVVLQTDGLPGRVHAWG